MYQQDKIQKSSLPMAQWATKKEAKGGVNFSFHPKIKNVL